MKTFLAWCAHAYTALGLVAAALIAVCIVRGDEASFRQAFVLMVIATFIDSTDGWFARKVNVRRYAPNFDGRRLDDLIDFHTYTTLPLLLLWRANVLPASQQAWLLVPLLASVYGFCQTAAKTEDHYFLGFPSYWNVLAFYLWLFQLPSDAALALLIFFALLTFVPARYLYTSQRGPFSLLTNVLAGAWGVGVIVLLAQWPQVSRELLLVSLCFPAYYLGVSWWITWRYWHGKRFAAKPDLA
jgi:phosphatidylcholine synthase